MQEGLIKAGFGLQVSGFGLQVSGFGFRVKFSEDEIIRSKSPR
jgi:hypothetical protein